MAATIATPRGTDVAVRVSTGVSTGRQYTPPHANARGHTVDSANSLLRGTVMHANARCYTVPVRLKTRRSADQPQDHGGSARILPHSAWERSWEEPPSQQ